MTEQVTQFLMLMIMPIGGLLIGAFMLFITRQDRIDAKKKSSSH